MARRSRSSRGGRPTRRGLSRAVARGTNTVPNKLRIGQARNRGGGEPTIAPPTAVSANCRISLGLEVRHDHVACTYGTLRWVGEWVQVPRPVRRGYSRSEAVIGTVRSVAPPYGYPY